MNKIKVCVDLYNVDILCVAESKFSKDMFDAEISIPGFDIFRNDRAFTLDRTVNKSEVSSGGGSVIYTKESLNASKIKYFSNAPDSVAIEINTEIGAVVIACVYRSQNLNVTQDNTLLKYLKKLCSVEASKEIMILGDFNMPEVSWISGNTKGQVGNNSITNEYLNMITDNGLLWYVTDQITRRRLVGGIWQESTLDQVLCTNDGLVNELKFLSPIGNSDHSCITVELNVDLVEQQEFIDHNKPKWSKISCEKLLELSRGVEWDFNSANQDVESMWCEFHGKLMDISSNVPVNQLIKGNNIRVPWDCSSLRRKRRKIDKQWAIFNESPSPANLNVALAYQLEYQETEISAKIKYEKKITRNLKHNSKSFFCYLRSKRKVKTTVNALAKEDGTKTSNASDAANVLADAFSSVFLSEPQGPLPEECYHNQNVNNFEISELEISDLEVKDKLSKLDIFKSEGPDGVNPKLLRALADNLNFVHAVGKLFRACAATGRVPLAWKSANVIPLFKKGSKSDPLNYRPVSLTSILCKVYEQFVRQHILDHVESKISKVQHGFMPGKSCFSNLLETVDIILTALDEGAPVDVLYLDFCKALDTVPHFRLLAKLEGYGITGSTLDIIRDFLTDRTMHVSVGGKTSL